MPIIDTPKPKKKLDLNFSSFAKNLEKIAVKKGEMEMRTLTFEAWVNASAEFWKIKYRVTPQRPAPKNKSSSFRLLYLMNRGLVANRTR